MDTPSALPMLRNDPSVDYHLQCRCKCHCFRVCNHEESLTDDDNQNQSIEWTWDHTLNSRNIELSKNNLEVTFHKHFSNGTAAIRGSVPLLEGQHYWEIKMSTSVYGTDMMVGFGTEHVNLEQFANKFAGLLGTDKESWGLSYTGNLVHNGMKRKLCSSFGQGITIGVHLDLWHGRMSLFRNGKYVGVAFSKGIRGKKLYPMVCSTAARTGMRIVRSSSFPTSLQFMCCQVLRNAIPADQHVGEAISLAPGLRLFLFNNLDWLLRPYCPRTLTDTVSNIRKRGLGCLNDSAGSSTQKKICSYMSGGGETSSPR